MKSLFRPFPVPLTGKQWFYLGILQGVGAGLIDGGANFGIAYAMYHNQKIVKMWIFSQNTIAGDLGVTPIIQCLASMLITSTLVHTDLHNKAISPLPFVYPHVENLPDPRSLFHKSLPSASTDEKENVTTNQADSSASLRISKSQKKGISYYYWMLVRFIFEGTENNILLSKVGISTWFGRLIWTAAQGALIGIVFGFPIWCLAIVILGPIYKMDNMGSVWAPQVIKLVYGAIVGWITNPVIAILALGSQAEHHLLVVPADEETAQPSVAVDTETNRHPIPAIGVERISEEQETLVEEPVSTPSKPLPTLAPPSPIATRTTPRRIPSSPSISLRPPLTTNVSNLSPLPTPLPQTAPPQGTFYTNVDNRPRAESTGSFTYSLGGTGGRAQRARAGSRASIPTISGLGLSDTDGGNGNASLSIPGRARSGSEYGTSSGVSAGESTGRTRAGSTPGRQRSETAPGQTEGAGASLALPVWDVFGRTDTPKKV